MTKTELIRDIKANISGIQKLRKHHELKGLSGACLSDTGEIMAYNAVIKKIEQLTSLD